MYYYRSIYTDQLSNYNIHCHGNKPVLTTIIQGHVPCLYTGVALGHNILCYNTYMCVNVPDVFY